MWDGHLARRITGRDAGLTLKSHLNYVSFVSARSFPIDRAAIPLLEQQFSARLAELEADREHLRRCNSGGEFMRPEDQARVREIAARRWVGPDEREHDFLSEEETDNLCIAKGTLNPAERAIIEEHVALTLRMLNALPWPKSLHNVPEYAGSQHETLDGGGYPRGLREQDLPIQARIICLADVFEALTKEWDTTSTKRRPRRRGS